MKKVLAIILSIAMLFGVLAINTVAETTANPTVTLVTNEGSPVAKGTPTYFTIRFDDFASIKGMDVTITADQYITLESVETDGGFPDAEPNKNYKIENDGETHTIRFVDLTNGANNGKLIFKAVVPTNAEPTADPTITVTGQYAENGKTLFEFVAPAKGDDTGNFVLEKKIESATVTVPDNADKVEVEGETLYKLPVEELVNTAKKFVPYGSVYKKEGDKFVFAEKDENGNFIADSDYTVDSFDIPANGITTFGVSENTEDTSVIRFGSYSDKRIEKNKNAASHGTMVFEGDWVALKNYYIKRGYTVQQLLDMIYKNYDATIAQKGGKFVYYKVPTEEEGKTTKVNVYKFDQTKYMWKDANVSEYAIRLTNAKDNITYTAVAYSKDSAGNLVQISENVKSETKIAKAN